MFYVFSIYCVVPKFRIKHFHLIYSYLYVCVSAWLCWNSCFLYLVFINVREREHWRGNKKWTIRRNWQHWVHRTQNEDNNPPPIHHYTQTSTHNVNRTWAIPQTTGGKDESNIVYMQKSQRTSQHGTQHVKTDNRTTQNNKQMSNTDPTKLMCSRKVSRSCFL
jgi:hypothetical protein